MDNVDPSPSSSNNCVVGVLKKANFSRVSNEEKLEIIRRFQNNPNFDEVDLYHLGLLDEESEEKIPKGSSETEHAKQPSKSRPNLDDNEIDYLKNPASSSAKKIPKGKRQKKKAVVVLDDHPAPEAEAVEGLLLLNHHPLPLDELPKKKKKKLKIIMSGRPVDDCPIDDISGPKKRPLLLMIKKKKKKKKKKKMTGQRRRG